MTVSYTRSLRILPLLLALAACADQPPTQTPEPGPEPKPAPVPLGVYQFTFTGIGGPDASGSAAPVPLPGLDGASAAMNPVTSGLAYELVSSSSFIEGPRGQGGHRYFTFTYRVRNSTGVPRSNLTLIPVSTSSTISGTPFTSLKLFNGAEASASIAATIVPTGAVALGEDIEMRSLYPDVLQVFEESEVAAITLPAGYTNIFPYGFVVRNANSTANRTLPVASTPNDFGGLLTFAFRVPMQPGGSTSDPFSITFLAMAVEDTETRMTESIEEAADTGAVRRARARATSLGVTTTTVLAGSTAMAPEIPDYPGQRQICTVRTAGTAAAPVTYITNPAAYARVMLLRPGEAINGCSAYFRSGTPGRPATNVPFTLTLSAMDRYGNLRTAVVDTVAIQQMSGPPGSFGSPAALVSGQRSIDVTYSDYGSSVLKGYGRRNWGLQPLLVAGVTRTWTAGASTTDWFTGANWSPAAVPMSLDSVFVPAAPAGGAFFPLLTANVSISGVTVENGGTLNLGPFDLTATGNVSAGLTGGITNTTGRLMLAGTARTVQGRLPRIRVTGTYSLTGNVNARAAAEVAAGRITDGAFRLQIESF